MDRFNQAIGSYVRLRTSLQQKKTALLLPWLHPSIPLYRRCIHVAVPSMLIGGAIELFMINTGFYSVVTRKEAERRLEKQDPVWEAHRRERRAKMAEEEKEKAAAEALRAAKRQLLQPPPQNPTQQ